MPSLLLYFRCFSKSAFLCPLHRNSSGYVRWQIAANPRRTTAGFPECLHRFLLTRRWEEEWEAGGGSGV